MDAHLRARVSSQVKAAFVEIAARMNRTPEDLLRALVLKILEAPGVPKADEAPRSSPGLTCQLDARIEADKKAQWFAKAKANGISSSAMLRGAVMLMIQSQRSALQKEEQTETAEKPRDQLRKKSLRLDLYEHEIEAMDRQAAQLGWRRSTWAVNVIRKAAMDEVRPTHDEVQALYRSCSELLAIGRNLNQLAHAMHRDDRYKDSVTVEKLDLLRKHIAEHVDASKKLIDAAENRWGSFGAETVFKDRK